MYWTKLIMLLTDFFAASISLSFLCQKFPDPPNHWKEQGEAAWIFIIIKHWLHLKHQPVNTNAIYRVWAPHRRLSVVSPLLLLQCGLFMMDVPNIKNPGGNLQLRHALLSWFCAFSRLSSVARLSWSRSREPMCFWWLDEGEAWHIEVDRSSPQFWQRRDGLGRALCAVVNLSGLSSPPDQAAGCLCSASEDGDQGAARITQWQIFWLIAEYNCVVWFIFFYL